MYMVGGGSSRVHRGNKPYPGAKRFMVPPKPPVNWRQVASDIVGATLIFALLLFLAYILVLGLG